MLTLLLVALNNVLAAYLVLIIARGVMGLLVHYGILNATNVIVADVYGLTAILVDPITTRLKALLPFLVQGSIDLSLVALYIVVQLIQAGLLTAIAH